MSDILQYLCSIGMLQLIGLIGFLVYMLAFVWVQFVWVQFGWLVGWLVGWMETVRHTHCAMCWPHPWWGSVLLPNLICPPHLYRAAGY